MDEIEKRLAGTSEHCFNCYEAWQKDKKDVSAREALVESVHEMRKVASAIEIELAVSERAEAVKKPLPIPPHRDAQRRPRDDDNRGNTNRDVHPSGPKPMRKRRPHKPKAEG